MADTKRKRDRPPLQERESNAPVKNKSGRPPLGKGDSDSAMTLYQELLPQENQAIETFILSFKTNYRGSVSQDIEEPGLKPSDTSINSERAEEHDDQPEHNASTVFDSEASQDVEYSGQLPVLLFVFLMTLLLYCVRTKC